MNSWQQELASSVTSSEVLLTRLGLMIPKYWVLITRRLFQFGSPNLLSSEWSPAIRMTHLLRQVLSVSEERILNPGFVADPLDEFDSALPGVLHKYRSRVLLIYRGGCAINCRYCFRRHFPYQEQTLTSRDVDLSNQIFDRTP